MNLTKQMRAIHVTIKKIIVHPIDYLLNIIIISLLISVIAIILSLSNTNVEWQKNSVVYPKLTVSLNSNASSRELTQLHAAVASFTKNNLIKELQYVGKDEAMRELQHNPQLKDITNQIINDTDNELPNIIIIKTNTSDLVIN